MEFLAGAVPDGPWRCAARAALLPRQTATQRAEGAALSGTRRQSLESPQEFSSCGGGDKHGVGLLRPRCTAPEFPLAHAFKVPRNIGQRGIILFLTE